MERPLDIDVLFFTSVWTRRPISSPFQDWPRCNVTWGHEVTTGIQNIDYSISTEDLEIEESDGHYTEKIVKLKSSPTYYYRPSLPTVLRGKNSFGL